MWIERPCKGPSHGRGAITNLPYPSELEETVDLPGVGPATVRPVRPEDEAAFHAGFAFLSPEDVRMRFFAPMKRLPDDMAFNLTHIDYDREMAFVMLRQSDGALVGVSRLVIYPGRERAEFAVIVRSDLKGHGIGRHLMKRLVDYARARNVGTLYGDILRENVPMTEFVRDLGFSIDDIPESEAIVRATCHLAGSAP
jgi:acetyltransferase